MLSLGIVETALELVPTAIAKHPSVVAAAKTRGRPPTGILLDEGVHSPAMSRLPDAEKRGRPDIVHRALLTILDSVFVRESQLASLFVHTYDGRIVEVDPHTRLPRRFVRFVGLMEQLLSGQAKKPAPGAEPLLRVRSELLTGFVQVLHPSCVILLTEDGIPTSPAELAKHLLAESNPLVLVGGFARGAFSQSVRELATQRVSVDPEPLSTSTVVGMVLHSLENGLDLAGRRFREGPRSRLGDEQEDL
jgi:rRNA small subunit pseudouridine methyltransferase Nep1